MAKGSNKNATKSFVMLIVTGVVLVAVTLCWFAVMDKSAVEKFDDGFVKNEATSQAMIYYGADANGKIAISPDKITQYVKVEDELIILENMFPGAEYTYVAEIASAGKGKKIIFDLDGIRNDTDSTLMESVKLNRRLSLMDNNGKETTDTSYKYKVDEIFLNKENDNPFEYTVPLDGKYRVYFSFKIDEETTVDKENMSIIIDNVDMILSD